jgi:hypothetical protein
LLFPPKGNERSTVSLELHRGYKDKQVFLDVVDVFRKEGSTDASHAEVMRRLNEERHAWSPKASLLREAIENAGEEGGGKHDAETVLFAALRRIGHDKSETLARRSLQAVTSAVERCVETQEYFNGHLYKTLNEQLQRTLIHRVLLQCNGALSRAAIVLGISVPSLEAKIRELG